MSLLFGPTVLIVLRLWTRHARKSSFEKNIQSKSINDKTNYPGRKQGVGARATRTQLRGRRAQAGPKWKLDYNYKMLIEMERAS